MFDSSVQRVGFACKFMSDQTASKKKLKEVEAPYNTKTTTNAWLNRQSRAVAEQRLIDIMKHNIASFENLVKYVSELKPERRMVRLSSDCLPMYTHDNWRDFWQQDDIKKYCETNFARVGKLARDKDVRLSMHPGQFVCLASDRPDVVDRSIEEFEYHIDMVRWMGFGQQFQDFKVNVHISGKQGPAGIRESHSRLSPEAKNCITIENEENKWGLDSCLEVADICPIVFDCHHAWVNEGEYVEFTDSRIQRVIDSWRGVRPTMHYSISKEDILSDHPKTDKPDMKALLAEGHKKGKLRAHSDYMWNRAVNSYVKEFRHDFDVMVESKCKNLAASRLLLEWSH